MTIFPQLEQQLIAASAHSAPAPAVERDSWLQRARNRFGLPLLAAGALATAGTALAAATLWQPIFGQDGDHPDLISGQPQQAGALAVLRRPASDADHTPDVQATLHLLSGKILHGLYPDTVRKVGQTDDHAIIVFALQRFADDNSSPHPYTVNDAICIGMPIAGYQGFGITEPCWHPDQINAGDASSLAFGPRSAHRFGLVPDGVARVTLTAHDGTAATQDITDNFYDFINPPDRNGTITWQAADGTTIPQTAPHS